MIEVLATNDPVKLSYAEAVLRDAGVEAFVLDAETSATFGGSLPWVKRRILVRDEDAERAASLLVEALPKDEDQ